MNVTNEPASETQSENQNARSSRFRSEPKREALRWTMGGGTAAHYCDSGPKDEQRSREEDQGGRDGQVRERVVLGGARAREIGRVAPAADRLSPGDRDPATHTPVVQLPHLSDPRPTAGRRRR